MKPHFGGRVAIGRSSSSSFFSPFSIIEGAIRGKGELLVADGHRHELLARRHAGKVSHVHVREASPQDPLVVMHDWIGIVTAIKRW
jgi:hypothetical protein